MRIYNAPNPCILLAHGATMWEQICTKLLIDSMKTLEFKHCKRCYIHGFLVLT